MIKVRKGEILRVECNRKASRTKSMYSRLLAPKISSITKPSKKGNTHDKMIITHCYISNKP